MPDNIMKYETVLPEDFDGVFRFTNWTEEDFVGVWGGRQYTFPALTTSPLVVPEHSPLEVQNIRKKFAKDLAEREFFRSKDYKRFHNQERNNDGSPRLNSIHQAGTYSLDDLAPFVQKCLESLPVSKALRQDVLKEDLTNKLARNEDGTLVSDVVDQKTSLKEKALRA